MAKLSRFQKNLNDYTFFLLMMCEKCSTKDLKLYDKYNPFEENLVFFKKLETELSDLIIDDNELLYNQEIPAGPSIKKLITEHIADYCNKEQSKDMKVDDKKKKVKNKEKKNILNFLKAKYLELSYDYPISKIDIYRTINLSVFITAFFLTILFIFIILMTYVDANKLCLLFIFAILSIFSLISWITDELAIKHKGSITFQFLKKFDRSYCYKKLIRSKEVLEQVLFENDPFQRLEENRLYRQIIKASPKMKIVFKVMIENSYWHYDGFNIVQTEKCTRQVIGKLATDSDLGINSNPEWKLPCQKLMLLPEPLYNYDKGKDDVTWEEIKQLIMVELYK